MGGVRCKSSPTGEGGSDVQPLVVQHPVGEESLGARPDPGEKGRQRGGGGAALKVAQSLLHARRQTGALFHQQPDEEEHGDDDEYHDEGRADRRGKVGPAAEARGLAEP